MKTFNGTRPTNSRWLIFGLACLTSWINYVHRYSWGVAKPYLRDEYGLDDAQMGWLDALFNITYAAGQFPGGLAGDLFGPRLVIPVAAVIWSLIVAAPGVFTGFSQLCAVRLGFGAAQASAYPNLGKITKSWFPLAIRTSVQGAVASFSGRAGAACAPLIVGTVLIGGLGLSWQSALWGTGLSGIVFAAVFWMLFRNSPDRHPWSNDAECRLIEADEHSDATGSRDTNATTDATERPLETSRERRFRFDWSPGNIRNVFFFCTASFCSSFADNLFVYWMPTFLIDEKGFGAVEMGVFASLPLWGGAVGGLCGGFINDILIRVTGNRRLARSVVASCGMVMAAALICVSLLSESGRVVMFVLFLCKFFSDMSQTSWWGTVTDIGGPAAGRVFGMVNTFGSLGAFAAGPLMGYVKRDFGWAALFWFVGGMYILTAFWWALVNCTRKLVVERSNDSQGIDDSQTVGGQSSPPNHESGT